MESERPMKRKGVPTTFDTQKGNRQAENVAHEEIQILGPSITDLPEPITVKILLPLPMKTLLICRCVCKTWRNVISDSRFAKLHYKKAPVCLLFRTNDPKRVSRTLLLAELEHNNIDMGRCHCKFKHANSDCDRHLDMKLCTKLKLPLRDAKMVLDKKYNGNAKLNSNGSVRRRRFIASTPRDHKFCIVNSCNGFLCLSEPRHYDPVVVCNPITGEFIKLPEASKVENCRDVIEAGLGFSPMTNQYKVIRIFTKYNYHPISGKKEWGGNRAAEIHTLGSGLWTSVGSAPISGDYGLKFPTYLNGALHWVDNQYGNKDIIVSFDLHKEKFQSFPSFPYHQEIKLISMAVLKDCLCIFNASEYRPIDFWVMKEYGVKESWTKMFKIKARFDACRPWPAGFYRPIKYFNNGAILLYHARRGLFYYDPARKKFKYLKLRESDTSESYFEAVAYTPSFVSLKDAVMGDALEVLNVNSRCAKFEIREEVEEPVLAEEDWEIASISSSSSEESY